MVIVGTKTLCSLMQIHCIGVYRRPVNARVGKVSKLKNIIHLDTRLKSALAGASDCVPDGIARPRCVQGVVNYELLSAQIKTVTGAMPELKIFG